MYAFMRLNIPPKQKCKPTSVVFTRCYYSSIYTYINLNVRVILRVGV